MFKGLARFTTRDILTRSRVAAAALWLFGGLFGAALAYFWPRLLQGQSDSQALAIAGAALGLPLLFAAFTYIYISAGALPTIAERLDNLKKAREGGDTF